MAQGIGDLQLALEALVLARVADHGLVRDLEGHFFLGDDVVGSIDIAHAALGEVAEYLEPVELVAYLQHEWDDYARSFLGLSMIGLR